MKVRLISIIFAGALAVSAIGGTAFAGNANSAANSNGNSNQTHETGPACDGAAGEPGRNPHCSP